jgi:ATP-dependent DNA helicase DinG
MEKKIDITKQVRERQFKLQEIMFNQMDYTLRPIQEDALDFMKTAINSGKKFIQLELPTGSGKSIWAAYFCKYYLENINADAKFDLLTNSKLLQKQYTDEFKFLNNLWGRRNYHCDKHSTDCETGKTLNNNTKQGQCEDCPFREAMMNWMEGRISLTNFHIHGIYSLFNPKIHENREADVLIVDECHSLEETLNGFVSFTLNAKTWKNIMSDGLDFNYATTLSSFTDISEFANFIKTRFLLDLGISENNHRQQLLRLSGKKMEAKVKLLKDLDELKGKMERFLKDYQSGTSEWIYEKQRIKSEINWIIQPKWTSEIMRNAVWKRYKHVILMSGTIIDDKTFNAINGIEQDRAAFVSMPSPFPVKNRPIYYYNQGKMSYANKANTWENFIPVIEKILKKYKGKKGIIHVGNYELMEWMKRDMSDNRLVFADSNNREAALNEHIQRDDDSVIVSPSMLHGVNLNDDLSRFQVILKVPYPSLASKVNKERLNDNPSWYAWRTVSDLVQAYGRSIRNETDYADTFILDGCFGDILAQYSYMLPKYFLEAIKRMK